jgi:hypothetical protein
MFEGLTIYRTQSSLPVGQEMWDVYEFAKGDPKIPHANNELALLVIKKPGNSVTLNYYPSNGERIEVYKDLALKDISEAIDYMKSKGFE